jgi:hypothetical protein
MEILLIMPVSAGELTGPGCPPLRVGIPSQVQKRSFSKNSQDAGQQGIVHGTPVLQL